MKRKSPVMAVALAGLFMYTSCSPTEQAETKDYTQYVNTFIGAADNGQYPQFLCLYRIGEFRGMQLLSPGDG